MRANTLTLFLGLNALDLLLTGVGLSVGCVEGGWYATFGLDNIWQITITRATLMVLILLLVRYWKFRPYIKYGNIVLVIVCLMNLVSILISL